MLKKTEIFMIWIQLGICCAFVLCMIIASKLFPDGNTENGAVLFLLKNVTIGTVTSDDRWSKEYPFEDNVFERYVTSVRNFERSVENYCTTSFPGSDTINSMVSSYKDRVMHYHIDSIPGTAGNRVYVSECVDNVLEFRQTVNDMDIPFLYVQTPSREGIDYYAGALQEDYEYNIGERNYCFTSALSEKGLEIINMDRDYSGGVTFDISDHWKPEDALKCAEMIASKLSGEYGFDMDPGIYDAGNFYDLALEAPEKKREIENRHGYDYRIPCTDTSDVFERIYAEEEKWTGTFREVLFKDPDKWSIDAGAYHSVFSINNSLINTVYDNGDVCQKKILVIGDSFSWPVVTYLSLGIKEITLIHNASFTGSLVSYIRSERPDAVIILYNDAEFYDIYTEDAFYLK
ncbi:MAG: hypothetical protein K5886_02990 [Lachnospiraceae bacterium]|nr:hypothetical protein [Lachnospiraceae bacterium]